MSVIHAADTYRILCDIDIDIDDDDDKTVTVLDVGHRLDSYRAH
jgi:mRNA-degrading endonuclease RelE of RelBE toxin-antitoxin system